MVAMCYPSHNPIGQSHAVGGTASFTAAPTVATGWCPAWDRTPGSVAFVVVPQAV
jgi:hypothetical protein